MKKRGFTLIELLAVIVVLAIIALIAIPIVMNVIENYKKGVAERSAENYLRAVETSIAEERLDGLIIAGTYIIQTDGNLCPEDGCGDNEVNKLKVEMNGNKPDSGTIVIENGLVTLDSIIKIGEYQVQYDDTQKSYIATTRVYEKTTASSTDTLTINSNGTALSNYKIYGNSVQNGTPTIDSPVEIESVGTYDEITDKYKIPVKVSDKNNEKIIDIYLDEPLRKIGDYADYIDFENKKVVRYIYNEFITKVSSKSSISGTYSMFLSTVSNKPKYVNDNILVQSNKFISYDGSYVYLPGSGGYIMNYITAAKVNMVAYTFNNSSINTLELAQEEIGTGFEVNYVLETPKEEKIDFPDITTFKGTTTLSVETNIKPTKFEVEYFSNK